jgi:16S rRNA (cytosine967-C5)-methyltransferase
MLCSICFHYLQTIILTSFIFLNYSPQIALGGFIRTPYHVYRRDDFTYIQKFHQRHATKKPTDHASITIDSQLKQEKLTEKVGNNNGALPRYVAAKALITKHGSVAFAVDRLESNLQYNNLSSRDRSFARLLVTTTERRLGQIDAILNHCQKIKSNNKPNRYRMNVVDLFVQAVLRIGAVQILFLHTPSHAAVKETVDTLRIPQDFHIPQAKINYVNAILRRISTEGIMLLSNITDVTANAELWLIDEWKQSWGHEATHRILSAAMEESPRCLTVNLHQHDKGQIISTPTAALEQIKYIASLFDNAEVLPQGSIRVTNPPPGPISTWPMYKDGKWWCQDPAATIPAIALYQGLSKVGTQSVETMHVVDLCAAPGGKTAQLSNYGFASITAVEVSSKRTERLIENMTRLLMNWNIVVADGSEWVPPNQLLVDGVLVDVPCTATGTGSKRPDVLRRDSDLTELLLIQQKIVQHVADSMVKVGGVIVYATCSLLKQESEDQVSKLLSRNDGGTSRVVLETLPFQPGEIPGFDAAIDSNGWIRVLPGSLPGSLCQCDGFFVARLQRVK